RIYGDRVAISTGVLKNRAEEAGGGHPRRHRGRTGRIYGDRVAISTGVLKNRAEEAGGGHPRRHRGRT
ncbi:hypothetical protein C7E12_23580, partial [Stenotrophomonas maltophilia]